MSALTGKSVLILATHGFEQSELEVPLAKLREAGATVHVASPESGEIKGWDNKDWGRAVPVDKQLGSVDASAYDAIVLPGGQMNPDTLRGEPQALELIKSFFDQGKVVAAICHGPWLLIDNGIARGRNVTSYKTIKHDLINAGAQWEDSQVVTDKGLVTPPPPADLAPCGGPSVQESRAARPAPKAA